MTQPTDTRIPAIRVFFGDLSSLRMDAARLLNFHDFLLERLADYTHSSHQVTAVGGRKIDPVDRDTFPRSAAGYGRWRLGEPILSLAGAISDGKSSVTFEECIADDRGGRSTSTKVKVPVDFIFGDPEREKRYALYRALKAEFEASETTSTSISQVGN